jgi:hypothetical protein
VAIIRGPLNPEAVEAVVLSYPGVVHAVAFGRANALGIEEVWVAVEAAPDIDSDAVRAHCARRLSREMVPVRVFRAAKMPRIDCGRRRGARVRTELDRSCRVALRQFRHLHDKYRIC